MNLTYWVANHLLFGAAVVGFTVICPLVVLSLIQGVFRSPSGYVSIDLQRSGGNASSLRLPRAATLWLGFLLLVPVEAVAQTLYGSIDGHVTDQTNAVVPGALVTALNTGTDESRQRNTNAAGGYSFPNLQTGTYSVTVTAPGFQTFTQTAVRVTVNSIVRVDAKLPLGAVTDNVTVVANAAVLQTDRSEVRQQIVSKELEDLPVPVGRNFQHLLRLLPGFSAPSSIPVRASNPSESLAMNVNGTSSETTNMRIDGATSMNLFQQSRAAYVPALESIETVDVVTNSFDAEQGLAGGAAINVQIKSGTNEVHGSAFEYLTNDKVKARPFFFPVGDSKPRFNFNQFGGTLGGPISKNRLFYFVSYEGTTDRRTVSSFATVPTLLAKGGDLSESALPVYDPATGDATGSNRARFADNLVPVSRQSSIAQKIIPLWPEPNQPGIANNFFATAPFYYDRHTVDSKVNWNASPKLTMLSRFSVLDYDMFYETVFGPELGGPTVGGGQSGLGFGKVYSLTTAATYVLTPNLILDAYFGYTKMEQNAVQPRLDENVGLDFLGIPGTNGPRRFEGGWPRFQIDGYTTVGIFEQAQPWFRYDPHFQYVANLNWTKANHNIRFGLDLSRRHLNHTQPAFGGALHGGSGGFRFRSGVTQLRGGPAGDRFNSFGSFLLGLPQNRGTLKQVPDQYTSRAWLQSFYVRDRWNVTPRLTFNYGLRWEYFPYPTRADRGLEFYDAATNEMLICGVASIPKDCGVSVSKKGFAPRVGFAYRASDTFVIRAGYGITNDPISLLAILRTNYPVLIGFGQEGASTLLPVGRLEDGIPAVPVPDLGNGIIDVPPDVVIKTVPKPFERGYVQSWNFTLQKELAYGFVGQAGYVATRQVRQSGQRDLNAGQVIGAGQAGRPLFSQFGRTANSILHTVLGTGQYNSLQATLERRFSRGLQVFASYTWSKTIGIHENSTDGPLIKATQYFDLNRTLVDYDRTHVVHITNIWELPFGQGRRWASQGGVVSAIVGGWQVNSALSFMSGTPFSVTASGTSLNLPGSTQRADQVKPTVQKLGGIGPGQSFFDPLAFAAVTQARFGTAGFNSLRGPGVINWDFGVFREFPITERWRLQFRVEALNFTNTPHFSNPGANASNLSLNGDGSIRSLGGFSEITSVNADGLGRTRADERNLRFGLRLSF